MNTNVAVYGLSDAQAVQLQEALPPGYTAVKAESITDLIVMDVICSVIDPSNTDKSAMRELLRYYKNAGQYLKELIVWLGDSPLPKRVDCIHYNCLQEMLPPAEMDMVVAQAIPHYGTRRLLPHPRELIFYK